MTRKWIEGLLATDVILILAIPAWAAEEKKCGPGTKRDELIEKVQKALSGKGYDAQDVDGKCGDKTLKAMNRFQQDNGLKETEWPDEPTFKKLLTPVDGVAENQTAEKQCLALSTWTGKSRTGGG